MWIEYTNDVILCINVYKFVFVVIINIPIGSILNTNVSLITK